MMMALIVVLAGVRMDGYQDAEEEGCGEDGQ